MKTMDLNSRAALKNILFATDFGAPASRALPFAVLLASQYGARLYAAHVIPKEAYTYASPESVERILTEAADSSSYRLQQTVNPLQRRGIHCETLVRDGEVADVIHDFVNQYGADLLVVGTSGRGGFGKLLLGSVAEELIRESSCPVLTVGPQVVTFASEGIHHIICATDFSPAAERAAELAVSLASEYDAHLSFVHVLEYAPTHLSHVSIRILEKWMRDTIPAESELFHEPEIVVEIGAVAERILRLASDLAADLVLMGVRGAGAFAHTMSRFGSRAHQVISEARCPVLTVSDPGEATASTEHKEELWTRHQFSY
jgi:nucleotide-binding universal stress UspA family protein